MVLEMAGAYQWQSEMWIEGLGCLCLRVKDLAWPENGVMLLLMAVCLSVHVCQICQLVYAPEQTGLAIRLRGRLLNTLNSD